MKKELINKFLMQLANKIASGAVLNYNLVYGWLAGYGYYSEGNMFPKNIADKFPNWEEYFANTSNIDVDAKTYSGFCMFSNSTVQKISECLAEIKLYIPVSAENIDETVKKLFDFLASENIKHSSKVRNTEGSDDIVIRLYNQEDANRMISFCQSDECIKRSLTPVNPFTISDNGIGITWDAMLSYNGTVAFWVADYLDFCNNNNLLDSVGYEKFACYVEKKMKDIFESGRGVDSFLTSEYHNSKYGFFGYPNLNYFFLGECEEAFFCLTKLLVGSLKSERVDKEYVYGEIQGFRNRIIKRGQDCYPSNDVSLVATLEQKEAFETFLLLLLKRNLYKTNLAGKCDDTIYDDFEKVSTQELAIPEKRKEILDLFSQKIVDVSLWDILNGVDTDLYRYSKFGMYMLYSGNIDERYWRAIQLFDDEINDFLSAFELTPNIVAHLWKRTKADELDMICNQIIKSQGSENAINILMAACDPIEIKDLLDCCSERNIEITNKTSCKNFRFYGNSLISLIASLLKEELANYDVSLNNLLSKFDLESGLWFDEETFDDEIKEFLKNICRCYIESRSNNGYAIKKH